LTMSKLLLRSASTNSATRRGSSSGTWGRRSSRSEIASSARIYKVKVFETSELFEWTHESGTAEESHTCLVFAVTCQLIDQQLLYSDRGQAEPCRRY
jgi:hypothetical protein